MIKEQPDHRRGQKSQEKFLQERETENHENENIVLLREMKRTI